MPSVVFLTRTITINERAVVRANLYAPRPDEIADPDRLAEIGFDFDNDLGALSRPVKPQEGRNMWTSIFNAALVALGFAKGLFEWYREQQHDKAVRKAAIDAERLLERAEHDKAVDRANRAAVDPDKLRDDKYRRPPKAH